ncbi:MAG: ATP-binding protein [Steroidobacteraceae bacterium]
MRPPGSPLYWRLFLTVAAAIVLFIVLALVTTALLVSRELEGYVHARQSTLGLEAANVYSSGGIEGLRAWLERTDKGLPSDVTIYIVAPDGSELLGRALPGWSARMMRAIAAHGQDPHPANYRPTVLAPQLIASHGEVLSMFVMPRDIGPWGSSTTTLGLVAVALLVIGAAAWIVARALTRPIMELQLAVRGLASGHVEARVPARIAARSDELGALATDFNAMAGRLEHLLEQRQRLLRDVSHELRSPLTRLQAAIVLSAHRNELATVDRERIEREIRRMDALIGDILRYSRLDDTASLVRRLVRLDDLLREIAEDARVEAAARDVDVHLRADPGLLVVGDPDLLHSAFENLVRNAVRHSAAGGRVEIVAKAGEDIRVDVLDAGPGVPEDLLERIFEPWFRVPGNTTPAGRSSGTGLGLAIARRVFTLHDGRVQARRRVEGGLAIEVHLPVADIT